MDLVCIPIPWTDYAICLGPNPLGIFITVVLLAAAAMKLYPGWQHRRGRDRQQFKRLVCSGQYGMVPHSPAERIYEGSVARCPVCGHTVVD